jgi:uncharacterized protein YutE (UPF0331/DUF86 family)
VLDYEAIVARLDKLDEYGKILKELRKVSRSEFVADYHVYGLAERYLQLSIECLLDIGRLIITGLGLRKPDRHQEVIEILWEADIISADLASRLQGIAGFRNILVHDYLKLNRNLVYENLQKGVVDLEDFSREIAELLKKG